MRKHNKPRPVLRISASRGFSEFTKNWSTSSHGHSTPSLKISCKSVQPFSRNLANKETKKETNKQRNRSKTIPCPPIYRGRGNNNYTRTMFMVQLSWLAVIARVHAMNAEQRQMAAGLWTKSTSPPVGGLHPLTSTIAMFCYYSSQKPILILPSRV